MANLDDVDTVVSNFSNYISQACERTFVLRQIKVQQRHGVRPAWYDRECRDKRAEVVRGGERATTDGQQVQ